MNLNWPANRKRISGRRFWPLKNYSVGETRAEKTGCSCGLLYKLALFSVSLGTAVIPRRNENQWLCKILGENNEHHVDVQVAYMYTN